jgi:hypothetical protein
MAGFQLNLLRVGYGAFAIGKPGKPVSSLVCTIPSLESWPLVGRSGTVWRSRDSLDSGREEEGRNTT